jgi:acyl carrier protein
MISKTEVIDKLLKFAFFDKDKWNCTEKEAPSVNFQDLGLIDSIHFFAFMTRIEKEFDVEFSIEEIEGETFRTIGGIGSLICDKLN